MIRGTKIERVCCDESLQYIEDNGYRYVDSLQVDKETANLVMRQPTEMVGNFYSKRFEDLYYIFFRSAEDRSTSCCDIFTKEAQS